MKIISSVSACVLLSALILSCKPDINTIKRIQSLEEGVQNPTTIEELTDAIKKYEGRADDLVTAETRIGSWYKILASKYLDQKMYGKALKSYQSAVEYYPTNQTLYFYIGLCAGYMAKASLDFEATGKTAERDRYFALAESAYLRAIELNPGYARALYGLSVLYVFELNAPAKAIPYLVRVLDIEKKNFDAMFLLARADWATGATDASVSMYDQIIKLSSDQAQKDNAEKNKALVLQNSYGKP